MVEFDHWTKIASVDFGWLYGLTLVGIYQLYEGKSLRWQQRWKVVWRTLIKIIVKNYTIITMIVIPLHICEVKMC